MLENSPPASEEVRPPLDDAEVSDAAQGCEVATPVGEGQELEQGWMTVAPRSPRRTSSNAGRRYRRTSSGMSRSYRG